MENVMSIIVWVALGLAAGFIGSKIVNKAGEGVARDMVLGVAGALVGGFMSGMFGQSGVTGLNVYSLVVATTGAVVVLLCYHAIRRPGKLSP
jgi:uncharacterized membrane protein YeaQ/YmgE (transglycosylase-associated protein family)